MTAALRQRGNNIGTSSVLIIVFAVIAWHYSIARDVRNPRRWALGLFVVPLQLAQQTWAKWPYRLGRSCGILAPLGGKDPVSRTIL